MVCKLRTIDMEGYFQWPDRCVLFILLPEVLCNYVRAECQVWTCEERLVSRLWGRKRDCTADTSLQENKEDSQAPEWESQKLSMWVSPEVSANTHCSHHYPRDYFQLFIMENCKHNKSKKHSELASHTLIPRLNNDVIPLILYLFHLPMPALNLSFSKGPSWCKSQSTGTSISNRARSNCKHPKIEGAWCVWATLPRSM